MLCGHKRVNCKTREWMWKKTIFLLCYFLAWLVTGFPVLAGEIQLKSFPVPVRVDRTHIESSLHIKCEFKNYELPFHKFQTMKLDAREMTFKKLVVAMMRKDLTTCLELTSPESFQSEEEMRDNIQAYIDAFREIFAKMHVIKQFYLGKGGLFVWGVDSSSSSSHPFRGSFMFETNSEGQFLWDGGKQDALSVLLTSIMQKKAESPTSFAPVEDGKFTYEYSIPGTTPGHVAYLQFSGKVYYLDIFADEADATDEVLSFYQKTYHTFRDKPPEVFAEFYTELSRDKYLRWISKMEPKTYKVYHEQTLSAGRKVVFILNADPVYIVLYRTKQGDEWSEHITYEYIVRDPKDGKLKLTNFYYGGFLDVYLKDPNLFVEPFLRPIITVGPEVTISAEPSTLWPPNRETVEVTIHGSATAPSGISSKVFTVTDEYNEVQATLSDFGEKIGLISWREVDDKDGRTYTVRVTVTDKAGNSTTKETIIIVPHDMAEKEMGKSEDKKR